MVSAEKEYIKIIRQIFEKYGFQTNEPQKAFYDIDAKKDNTNVLVETKLYSSKISNSELLDLACKKLLYYSDKNNSKLVLVVSNYVNPTIKEKILKEKGIIVWDVKTLFALAFDYYDLYYSLESLLMVVFKESVSDISVINKDIDNPQEIIELLIKKPVSTVPQIQLEKKGERLYNELLIIPAGKKNATNFEKKCTEILKYLFDGDKENSSLSLWKEQKTTEESLHRFDLICKIDFFNASSFWKELSQDFRTRFILFEFKNYKEKIKQGEIFTTEKYLFVTAFRTVCFIIARNGADGNAQKVAKGALKEAGKLIVILSKEDVQEMLIKKDNGDEPEIILQEEIDKILMELTR